MNKYINVNNLCLFMLERADEDGGFSLEIPFIPKRK